LSKAILPFLAVQVVVIFLITYIPALTLAVPRLFGFVP
jgi:TRAP-type transport system large permease protein